MLRQDGHGYSKMFFSQHYYSRVNSLKKEVGEQKKTALCLKKKKKKKASMGILAQSQEFCRHIRCIIKQLYQTEATDHQFIM